jgi:predicted nucleic acid-binding protein
VREIADAGLIVAYLGGNDPYHEWALEVFPPNAPFYTCDIILGEAASFFADPVAVLALVARGDLILDPAFVLVDELPRILALATKYADHPMDLADACLVRMSELSRHCRVWTTDRADFSAYRRHGREPIPCEFPPE